MLDKVIDLSPYRDLDIKSITMKPVTADDMVEAASRCVPPDGSNLDQNMFGVMLRQHMLIQAIVAVDGKDCVGPCLDFLKWTQRTREFIGKAYEHMNSMEEQEALDFKKALTTGATPSG